MLSDYNRTFDKDILPLLRKQNGFRDEITFSGAGGIDVTTISLWDNKASAEDYNTTVLDCVAFSHSAQGVKLVSTQPDYVFQHWFWRRGL